MAIKINNDIVIDNDKKFYGDGSNIINVSRHLIIGVRETTFVSRSSAVQLYNSNQLIVGPIGLAATVTVFGRTLNTNVTTV